MVLSFFVYGTLKRNQCRQHCWPAEPLSVSPAWTSGQLFSRADYPAMIEGSDRVIGELWTFVPNDIDRVVEVIDRIEEVNQDGCPDLYRRVIVPTYDLENELWIKAFTYLYQNCPVNDGFSRVIGSQVQWPKSPQI